MIKSLINLGRFVWSHPLNVGGGRRAALTRLVQWQFASRVLKADYALPFVNNTRLVMSSGMQGLTGNWYCGLHEYKDMGFTLHMLTPHDLFIDVGANAGSYTILAAGAVGATAISVEPVPATFHFLLDNIRVNDLSERVTPLNFGLSTEAGTLRFTIDRGTTNQVVSSDTTSETMDVPVQTLDMISEIRRPALIKIDVEGWEHQVLRGGSETLGDETLLAVIIETNGSTRQYGSSDEEIADVLSSFGFKIYDYDPALRRLIPAGLSSAGNTLFVRDLQAVTERIQSAPKYKLVNGAI